MITNIEIGDIMGVNNTRNVIIGMNTTLEDLRGLGLRADSLSRDLKEPLKLGSILTFKVGMVEQYDRFLHMLICHNIGFGGWQNAPFYVRCCMDYLYHLTKEDPLSGSLGFSTVKIGTGEIGKRDGADEAAILKSICESYLPVTLYVRDTGVNIPKNNELKPLSMSAYAIWHPNIGSEIIAA